jgi:DNA replication and repair protein RecF
VFSLKHISLVNFKNYYQASFDFNERVIGICGNNGVGKTNLLDAIYYLCFTKSHFSKNDASNTSFGQNGFRLEGQFCQEGNEKKVVCILRENARKEFFLDNIQYDKFSLHIGKFPCVMIAPDDIELVTGGSEERRRFLDTLVSQLDAEYLQKLISYNKILLQRNSLLKSFSETGNFDFSLLDVIDRQLSEPGQWIHEQRKKFLEEFIPIATGFYHTISGKEEKLNIGYASTLLYTPMHSLMAQGREKDILLQRTGSGVHKEDLELNLEEESFKTAASQGQRKSLLFALKLAEFEILKKYKGFSPILLLDDVFEKLDELRMQNLLTWACRKNSGQIFITDTHCERLQDALEKMNVAFETKIVNRET